MFALTRRLRTREDHCEALPSGIFLRCDHGKGKLWMAHPSVTVAITHLESADTSQQEVECIRRTVKTTTVVGGLHSIDSKLFAMAIRCLLNGVQAL